MDLELTDKVAVVTGANKGIGFAVTAGAAGRGRPRRRRVAEHREPRRPGPRGRGAREPGGGGRAGACWCSGRSTSTGDSTCWSTTSERSESARTGFCGTSDEEFEWALQMDFFTGLRATRAALGPMLEQRSGSIVNVASVNSFFQPDAATIDYGVAKAAVVNLSKSLSQEFGPQGIRVNCVSPGQVSTDLWLGEHGVAATVAKSHRRRCRHGPRDGRRQHRHRTVHHARRGRDAGHDAGLRRLANVTGVNYVIDGGLIKTT